MDKKGFTLVELSIVLVIVGLLIGGILVAQSMIRTVKVQRFISDLAQYEVLVRNFKTVQRFYPGDAAHFTPAGDADNRLNGSVMCKGKYAGEEVYQTFPQISQAGMTKENYIPYEPDSCPGGTHDSVNVENELTKYSFPKTELDNYWVKYMPVFLQKENDGNPFFSFYVKPEIALALEAKFGLVIRDDQGVGLSNFYVTAGQCGDINDSPVLCTDPTALFGGYYYYMQPM